MSGVRCEVTGCRGNAPCGACLAGLSVAIEKGLKKAFSMTEKDPLTRTLIQATLRDMKVELDGYWATAVAGVYGSLGSMFILKRAQGDSIVIDTRKGDDKNLGTLQEPIKTFKEAERRLIAHEYADAARVPCPFCKAKPGDVCISPATQRPVDVHRERIDRASKEPPHPLGRPETVGEAMERGFIESPDAKRRGKKKGKERTHASRKSR